MRRKFITTPIYYVNDRPHIGHAYCTVLADTYARYFRLFGEETYFLTGTDEHGQKVQKAAAERGVSPRAHVDELHSSFKDLWPELNIEVDDFIRTTEPRHTEVVQAALQKLHDRGDIYLGAYEGWYSVRAERFWTEKDLVDGRCPDTGGPVERVREENYFFRMGKYVPQLIAYMEAHRDWVVPASRWQEVRSFLEQEISDLSISRPKARLAWGIPLPFDDGYVTYVWFDALLNYASAIGLFTDPERFETWWPHAHHFIGKDILTTHTVYWGTMLLALGLALPKRICATGWWLTDNTKMSKSLGNVVDPLSLRGSYGPDVLRYCLMRDMVIGLDASFSEEAVVRRNNSDLANDLGNLLRRTLAQVRRHFDGRVPPPGPAGPEDADLRARIDALPAVVEERVRSFRLHEAIEEILQTVRAMNRYIDHTAPFKVIKTEPARAGEILRHVLEGLHVCAVLLSPVLPEKMIELRRRVGAASAQPLLADLRFGLLEPRGPIGQGEPLFPRREFEAPEAPEVASTPERPAEGASGPSGPEGKGAGGEGAGDAPVPFADFARVQLRVGRIQTAEPVRGAKKLLRLEVDCGEPEPRTLVAGIAGSYAPEDLPGRLIVVVANLAPKKIFGIRSHGMALLAYEGDRLSFIAPDRDLPPGTPIR